MTVTPAGSQMLTALVRLRAALQGAALPLEVPGVHEHRSAREEMVNQLEDYVIPRIVTLEAPLLVVVGGSTGAGKSTLVNSLVGAEVTNSHRSAAARSCAASRRLLSSTESMSGASRIASPCGTTSRETS